jgi:hypothetical protein
MLVDFFLPSCWEKKPFLEARAQETFLCVTEERRTADLFEMDARLLPSIMLRVFVLAFYRIRFYD